jgi:hypothetical protein
VVTTLHHVGCSHVLYEVNKYHDLRLYAYIMNRLVDTARQ